MLSFISDTYSKFQTFMASWKVWQIVLFAIALPIATLIVQIIINAAQCVFARAFGRLKRFLKSYSYLSPSTVFAFDKKVVRVFPRNIRSQTKHIADTSMPMDEYLNTFNFCSLSNKKSIIGWTALAHIVLLGVAVAMNGYSVGVVSAAILSAFVLWLVVLAVESVADRLLTTLNRKYRKKFITKLDANTLYHEKQVDLSLPKVEVEEDSAMRLANSVEEFLASHPDKSIAEVVLKGIYSAKFSSAMTRQSKLRLRNVVDELKNYVV